jgi:hypothetical protein
LLSNRAVVQRKKVGSATKCASTEFGEHLFFKQDHGAWPLKSKETTLLSPHEIAALMLLKTDQHLDHLDLGDLDALCERQLVMLEKLASGYTYARLTAQGRSILRSVERVHSFLTER